MTEQDAETNHYAIEDESCIACGLCHERAPRNIEMDEREMVARVVRQPAEPEEEEACREAADYCPTGGLAAVPPEPSTG